MKNNFNQKLNKVFIANFVKKLLFTLYYVRDAEKTSAPIFNSKLEISS